MTVWVILLSPFAGYLVYYLVRRMLKARRQRRREALRARPFPAEWRHTLEEQFPLYRRLPPDLQRRLEGHIQVFLQEKVILGRGGFTVTDAVRVLIAAQACLLILNRPDDYYPGFETILVYPETYAAPVTHQDGYLQTESEDSRAGESWHRGPVILAWNEVLQGARNSGDGHNVVMHEFAHKLDEENTYMDGLPILPDHTQQQDWATVLSEAFNHLRETPDAVIDDYGATSAAEFFAVVTEAFFEKAPQLKHTHPALYQQLQRYYQLDPVEWDATASRSE